MQSLDVYKYIGSLARSRADDVARGREETTSRNRTFKGSDTSIHVIAGHNECVRILKDPSFIQPRIADAIAEIGKTTGAAIEPIENFLRNNPIEMNAPAHAGARRTAIREYGDTQRSLAGDLSELGREAFRNFLERKKPSILDDLAEPYVDAVLESIFNRKSQAAPFTRESWNGASSCIFEYLHPAAQLKKKAQQASGLAGEFHSKIGGDDGTPEKAGTLLLTYVLQGRDPLIGAITAYMHALLGMNEDERRASVETIVARDLFWRASPVNYIGRIATKAASVGSINVQPGDEIVLMLSWANHDRHAEAQNSLAFGAGGHMCAGQALALAIADGWLSALRHHHVAIEWNEIVSDRPVMAVFRQYRNQ